MSPTSEHTNTVPCETHTPPTGRRSLAPPAPRRTWFTGFVLGAVAAVTAFLLLPYGPDPDLTFEGDPELVTDLEAAVDPDLVQGLVTARFPVDDPDDVEWADGGTADGSAPVGPDTPFETASVFKAFTGMTLIDMVEKGETSLDRTLAEVFPEVDFADPAVAAATLEEVATHHAGLSAVPVGDDPGGILRGQVLGDLYRTSMPAREYLPRATAVAPGTFVYSNMGYAVLGEALAEESGTPYEELVRERVLDPLGMDDTVISGDGVPEGGAEPPWARGLGSRSGATPTTRRRGSARGAPPPTWCVSSPPSPTGPLRGSPHSNRYTPMSPVMSSRTRTSTTPGSLRSAWEWDGSSGSTPESVR